MAGAHGTAGRVVILANPVKGTIGLAASDPDLWFRSQPFGCTGFAPEPPLGSCKHFHRGVDIARGPAGCGDDVLAVADGTVIYSGTLIGGSKAIVIRHAGNTATGVSHLNSRNVSSGKVKAGQKIGTVGKTGNATGCHVHLAYKTNFPLSGDVNDFYLDKVGKWADAWPQLAQNVTVHPKPLDSIRLRTAPALPASAIYAETKAGRIVREDGVDIGSASAWLDWGGTVTGADYGPSNQWEKLTLDGHTLYLAAAFAVLSAT